MTEKFGQFLGEKLGLDSDTQNAIQEAWDNKISEARKEIAAELREDFAKKFEHDKDVIVESMEGFLTEGLRSHIEEIAEDKKKLRDAIVEYKTKRAKDVKVLEAFVAEALAAEMKEFRKDRASQKKNLQMLEGFVIKQLTSEIKEFHEDKKALQEQRVKIVREGKKALAEAKQDFLKKSAVLVESSVEAALREELTQFRNDIKIAKENEFGRKIFEAVSAEFLASHLDEGTEVKRMQSEIAKMNEKIAEALSLVSEKDQLVEASNKKLALAKDLLVRERKLGRLLAPLSKDKKAIMSNLLESVKTDDLERNYNKYLPSVLNETNTTQTETASGKVLAEGRTRTQTTEKTGDRTKVVPTEDSSVHDIAQMKKLAGIK